MINTEKNPNLIYGMWIAIEWVDSKHESGWQPEKRDVLLGKVSTVGLFLSSDEEKITVAHSLTGEYSHSPISIPWSCVKCVKRLEVFCTYQ